MTRGGSAAFAKAEVGVGRGRWWQKGRQPSRAKKADSQGATSAAADPTGDRRTRHVLVITVCSQMGGVGKTLISAYLATLAAHHRTNDRVLAYTGRGAPPGPGDGVEEGEGRSTQLNIGVH